MTSHIFVLAIAFALAAGSLPSSFEEQLGAISAHETMDCVLEDQAPLPAETESRPAPPSLEEVWKDFVTKAREALPLGESFVEKTRNMVSMASDTGFEQQDAEQPFQVLQDAWAPDQEVWLLEWLSEDVAGKFYEWTAGEVSWNHSKWCGIDKSDLRKAFEGIVATIPPEKLTFQKPEAEAWLSSAEKWSVEACEVFMARRRFEEAMEAKRRSAGPAVERAIESLDAMQAACKAAPCLGEFRSLRSWEERQAFLETRKGTDLYVCAVMMNKCATSGRPKEFYYDLAHADRYFGDEGVFSSTTLERLGDPSPSFVRHASLEAIRAIQAANKALREAVVQQKV